jgi:TetR/AcrR family transcriptional regulator, repressor for uid operon
MSVSLQAETGPKIDQRRLMIMEAALKAFSKKGFEAATIQDVAAAAGMSAGNIYRYFPSKAAIIAGFVEMDRAELEGKFASLARENDQVTGFERIGRDYFTSEAVGKAPMTLEIWAAGCRNADVKGLCNSFEESVQHHLTEFMARAERNGQMAPGVDHGSVGTLLRMISDGFIRMVAHDPSIDPDRLFNIIAAVLGAALSGKIELPADPTKPRQ